MVSVSILNFVVTLQESVDLWIVGKHVKTYFVVYSTVHGVMTAHSFMQGAPKLENGLK